MAPHALGDRVHLHPLTFLHEGDEVVVGRAETDDYAVFPADGAALLQRLMVEPVDDAARWYAATYGEQPDVEDLLDTLAELGFLRGAQEEDRADREDPGRADQPLRGQALGRVLFSAPAWVLYGLLVAAGVAACVQEPRVAPRWHAVFFSHYLLVVELTVAVGQGPLVLLHELFHLLAARRLGVRARIRLGHRLWFVVAETVMDGLVAVPRRSRYLPVLAGMLADVLVVSALTLTARLALAVSGPSSLVAGVCLALAFSTLVRVALELVLPLRTDVYYLVATACGCVDLHGTSAQRLREAGGRLVDRLARRPRRATDPSRWHPRDLEVARWYAPLHAAGYAVLLALLVRVLLPISWHFLTSALRAVATGDVASPRFWDAAGLLALNVAQPALALLLRLRDTRPELSARLREALR